MSKNTGASLSRATGAAKVAAARVRSRKTATSPTSQPLLAAPGGKALLPHERDQQPQSQASPQAPNHEVGEQAFLDVSRGLVDTDDALRASTVARRRGTPPRLAGNAAVPRRSKLLHK